MSSKILTTFSLLIWSLAGLAHIQYGNSVNQVYYKGPHEQGGFFSISATADDFPNASPETPIFVEIVLDNNALLAHTLVDQTNQDPNIQGPIFLPMKVDAMDQTSMYEIAAPANTLSIVRWVQGEGSLWLRIQNSSSTWLQNNGSLSAPSANDHVTWGLGFSASFYQTNYSTNSNLPFPTRFPETIPAPIDDAISTPFCLDLSQSSLEKTGLKSILSFSANYYNEQAETLPGLYERRNELDVEQVGLVWTLAWARDRVSSAGLSSEAAVITPCTGDVLSTTVNYLNLDFKPQFHLNPVFLHKGSYILLETNPEAPYGFRSDGARFLSGVSSVEVVPESAFTVNGEMLYHEIRLIWEGEHVLLRDVNPNLSATLSHACDQDPWEMVVDVSVYLMSGSPFQDEPPFTGPSQQAACEPQAFLADSNIWLHSARSSTGVLPHVTKPGNGFQTGIILANTADIPQSYVLAPALQTGAFLTSISGVLEPGETVTYDSLELFQGEDVSHFRADVNEAVKISAFYKAEREETGPAHVSLKQNPALKWRIYPGNSGLTWDGIAILNAGALNATVSILQKNNLGETLDQETLILAPNEKALMVLSERFQATPDSYYDLVSTLPLHIMSLRGDLQNTFLWENHAISID